jgi:phosphatidylserine/phosphatidylglycerophosphate/cardiolipin synthase-like enzyme
MIREHRANKSLTRDTLASQAGSSDRPVERAESPATGSPANLRQRPFRLNQTLGATETQMGVHDLNRANIRLNFGPERNAWFTAIPRAFPGSSAARIRRSGSGNRWPDWAGLGILTLVMLSMRACEFFLYEKGYLHAKTIRIDSKICSIGSANIDFAASASITR